MSNLVVHVGYPKTATTTFQKHVFPHHSDIDYLGKSIPDMSFRTEELRHEIQRLVNEDEVRYDGGKGLRRLVEELHQNCRRKVLLLSHENFIHHWGNDTGLVARRIREVFGPCRILITLRDQVDVIRSFYAMHGRYCTASFLMATQKEKVRTPLRLDDWLRLTIRAPEMNIFSILHYYDVIRYYVSLFGRDNVGVFLYEHFVKDSDDYVRRLCDFLGIDPTPALERARGKHENRRFTTFELCYLRVARLLGLRLFDWSQQDTPGWVARLRNLFGTNRVHLSEEWHARLCAMYGAGNRRLAAEFGLPLEQFGYPLAAEVAMSRPAKLAS